MKNSVQIQSARHILRYGVVLLAGLLAGMRGVSAVQAWQEYLSWRVRDPSGADAFLSFAKADATIAVLGISLAALVWWLLRPPSGRHPI
jgi:hypothetical protein